MHVGVKKISKKITSPRVGTCSYGEQGGWGLGQVNSFFNVLSSLLNRYMDGGYSENPCNVQQTCICSIPDQRLRAYKNVV